MKVNINVKKTFKINGKEYHSLDEMPGDIRELFSKAQQHQTGPESHGPSKAMQTKVMFNGTEYDSMDAMPSDIRNVYEKVMKTASAGGSTTDAVVADISRAILGDQSSKKLSDAMDQHQAPMTESAFSAKKLIVSGLVLALIALLYFLLRR